MAQDYLLWKNDIEHRFSPTSLTDAASGSGYIATSVISSVTKNSAWKMSLWDAYFDLRCKVLGVSEAESVGIAPQGTTTELSVLTGIIDGQGAIDITTGAKVDCIDGDFVSGGGGGTSTYRICTRGFYVPSSSTKRYFPMSGTTSDQTTKGDTNRFIVPSAGRLESIALYVDETHTGAVITLENASGILGTKTVNVVANTPLIIDFTTGLDSGTNEFGADDVVYVAYYHINQASADTNFTLIFEQDI